MTERIIAALRGAFAKPMAQALLEVLPAGVELKLEREPENKFDANAITVTLQGSALKRQLDEMETQTLREGVLQGLTLCANGYGREVEEILELEWPLGYVGKEWAAELAPQADKGAKLMGWLSFNGSDGKPQVEVEIE